MAINRVDRADLAIKTSFFLVAAVMAVAVATPQLERWEPHWFPVIEDFRVRSVEADGEFIVIAGDMVKARDCDFVSLSFYAGDPEEPKLMRERLDVAFLDQPVDADVTREPGRQIWGPWRLHQPRTAIGPRVFMRVTHRCHPFWNTSAVYLSTPVDTLFPAGCSEDPGREDAFALPPLCEAPDAPFTFDVGP